AHLQQQDLALWRKDLLAVNGFEESYEGWGLEDTDLVIRLLRNGQKHRSGRFLTSLFHLWHPENDRSRLKQNQMLLDQLLKATSTRAQRGLEQSAVSASS
ncbi:MAG: glycosyl transferase family 2, partial [Betaproteobacteria bacterium]|nr:glycosyl transferase family 2 [Betaproteobacteria bacterium]